MPDFTVKGAWDPHGGGWGHYEIFGLARGFRDRVDTWLPALPSRSWGKLSKIIWTTVFPAVAA